MDRRTDFRSSLNNHGNSYQMNNSNAISRNFNSTATNFSASARNNQNYAVGSRNVSSETNTNGRENSSAGYEPVLAHPNSIQTDKIGKNKGIEGRNNSCYLDSTLMAFFYGSTYLDEFFYPACTTETQTKIVGELKALLSVLKTRQYCSHENTTRLRNALAEINSKLNDEMMDVEELITTLCGQALNLHPFIEYQTGTSNYYHQLIVNSESSLPNKCGFIPLLLKQSLANQNLQISRISDALFLLKMPRANGSLISYEVIIPSLTLHIPIVNDNEKVMELQAVICLKHCHYTCFIRFKKEWYYYDSMAGDGPEVTHVEGLENAMLKIQNYWNPEEWHRSKKSSSMVNRLISDVHICVYVDQIPEQKYLSKMLQKQVPPNSSTYHERVTSNGTIHADKQGNQNKAVTQDAMIALSSLLYLIRAHAELFDEFINKSPYAEILRSKNIPNIFTQETWTQWMPLLKQIPDASSAVEFLNKLGFPKFIKYNDMTESMTQELLYAGTTAKLTIEDALKFSLSNRSKFSEIPKPVLILTSQIKRRTNLQIDISCCLDHQKTTVLNLKAVIVEERNVISVYTRNQVANAKDFRWTYFQPYFGSETNIPKLDVELDSLLKSYDKSIRDDHCKRITECGRIWIYG